MSDITVENPVSERSIFGHPRGLAICFLTEMWERFSYYGMRALLIFYLTQHFLFSQSEGGVIYGTYISLVYLTPMIGGFLADRYLGSRKAVTIGAILLVLGHAGMAFEGAPAREYFDIGGTRYEVLSEGRGEKFQSFLLVDGQKSPLLLREDGFQVDTDAPGFDRVFTTQDFTRTAERDPLYLSLFYLSLALIITGVGFLKPNISTIVGALYPQGDPRRDPGFTIFYMGINLGSLMAALACGYLGETYGWAYGFGLAGIGMLAGLIIFQWSQPWLDGKADPPSPALLKEKGPLLLNKEWTIYLGAAALVLAAWFFMENRALVALLLNGFGIATFGALIYFSIFRCAPEERDRMLVAVFLILCQLPFWALFEQTGSSLNLLTKDAVDRNVMGLELKASMFQSVNSIFIVLLAPLFAWAWVWLSKRRFEPSTPVKFAIGIFLAGAGFLALVVGIELAPGAAKVSVFWIFLIYLIHTMGELCLSPVGLSMVTKLSVARVVGAMMGGWMLAQAFSGYISGLIAKASGAQTIGGQIINIAEAKAGYVQVYTQIGWFAIGFSVFVLLLSPLLKKRMHGIH